VFAFTSDKNHMNIPQEYANKKAVIQTNKGQFTVEFFDNDAPKTVENFIRLSQQGSYNNVPFHRIIKGFMIQSGDYTAGNGTGGDSIYGGSFADELDADTQSYKTGYERGVLAMANRGADTNGSQFFINLVNNNDNFGGQRNYTIFAKVTAGMDVVDKIAETPVAASFIGDASVPKEHVVIEKVTIENR
jgi:cyclophilin family peptidyl-prolyl cis-trans isomerase